MLSLRSLSILALPAVLLGARPARAESPPPAATDPVVGRESPPTRRSGFTLGADVGGGLISIVGFPNDVRKIGYQSYYTATGARPGFTGEGWIGAAFTDWFVFGLGVSAAKVFATGDHDASSFAGMFHIEAYPLFPLGGHLRDLGVRLDAGTGVANVTEKSGAKLVDSSAASFLGGGVFYEGLRLWRIGQGPFLMGNYMWSDTVRRPAIFLGWRASFAAGP